MARSWSMGVRVFAGWLALTAGLAGAGCSTNGRPLQSPTAKVTSVKLVDSTPQGARLRLTVELSNPNQVSLPMVHVRYAVKVEGAGTYRSTDKPLSTIPDRGVQTITLAAAFATDGRRLVGAPYAVEGTVVYEPPGQIRKAMTESKIPLPEVRFSQSGRLN